jgi:dephospho-CoA kinase
MLRVGLTGDLGSGKSTVARMLAQRGAVVFSSDEMARAMMQPGQAVYAAIVEHFGQSILAPDTPSAGGQRQSARGRLIDRRKLAELAFDSTRPQVAKLNAIVHPAVLHAQSEQIAALTRSNPHAIAVVESALIFSTQHAPEGAWKGRFDRILMVTAPEPEKIARFIKRLSAGREITSDERATLEADARRRLALQHTASHAAECVVLSNDGTIHELERQVAAAWRELQQMEADH